MKIIVTNAHSRTAYRCVKALAEIGHEVITGDFIPFAMSFYSKFSSGRFTYPSPYKDQAAFLKCLLDFAAKNGVQFILPIHEETFIFSKYHREIPESIHLTVPDYSMILSVHNKDRLHMTATETGIPVPNNIIVRNERDLDYAIQSIDYPVVLKPRQGGGNYGIRFIYEQEKIKAVYLELIEKYDLRFDQVQIQEYIPAKEKYSQVMIFNNGEPCAKFTDKHLRDYPFEGGAGCFRTSTRFPEIEQYTENLLRHLKWHGIAEAEYIVSQKDTKPYLIEINPRIWGGVNSAISSGMNIPKLLLKIAFNEGIERNEISYCKDVKTRWLFGDLKTLKRQLQQSNRKFSILVENLNIFKDDIVIDEFCKTDPLPFIAYPLSMLGVELKKRYSECGSYYSLQGEWE